MFGIRNHNFNYDIRMHDQSWPCFEEFLNLSSLDHLPEHVQHHLSQRIKLDPIYHRSLHSLLKHNFPGSEQITQTYSQSWQDFFVLTMLNGKTQGTYLELGCSEPEYMNNTLLLEQFGWTGVSVDFRSELADQWSQRRPASKFVLADLLNTDLAESFQQWQLPQQVDYLQLDLCDWATVEAMEKIPHDQYRFSIITFETDIFQADPDIQSHSRKFLQNLGYQLLIDNVAVKNYATDTWEPFEDWWVDPVSVDQDLINKFMCVDGRVKLPHHIFTKEQAWEY